MSVLVISFHHLSGQSSWIFFHLESQFFESHHQLLQVEQILQPVVHHAVRLCLCLYVCVSMCVCGQMEMFICDRISLDSISVLFVCAAVDRLTNRTLP